MDRGLRGISVQLRGLLQPWNPALALPALSTCTRDGWFRSTQQSAACDRVGLRFCLLYSGLPGLPPVCWPIAASLCVSSEYAGTQLPRISATHPEGSRQIDSRASRRKNTDNEQHRPGPGSGPSRRSPSTPARLRRTWKPPAGGTVRTVPAYQRCYVDQAGER